MKQIKEALITRGYTEKQANILSDGLSKIDSSLKPGLDNWIANGVETNYTINGVVLSEIKNKFKMTYLAALLTMDWVIREPEKAISNMNKGIK